MFHRSKTNLVESVKTLQSGLARHFREEELQIHRRYVPVEDIIETLAHWAAQVERADDAYATFIEESNIERDEFRADISPLLIALRKFIAAKFGPYSPRMREFGFTPVQVAEHREPERDEDAVPPSGGEAETATRG
jgi:hypothetical protein